MHLEYCSYSTIFELFVRSFLINRSKLKQARRTKNTVVVLIPYISGQLYFANNTQRIPTPFLPPMGKLLGISDFTGKRYSRDADMGSIVQYYKVLSNYCCSGFKDLMSFDILTKIISFSVSPTILMNHLSSVFMFIGAINYKHQRSHAVLRLMNRGKTCRLIEMKNY